MEKSWSDLAIGLAFIADLVSASLIIVTLSFVHYIKTIRDKHNEFTFHIVEKTESSS